MLEDGPDCDGAEDRHRRNQDVIQVPERAGQADGAQDHSQDLGAQHNAATMVPMMQVAMSFRSSISALQLVESRPTGIRSLGEHRGCW